LTSSFYQQGLFNTGFISSISVSCYHSNTQSSLQCRQRLYSGSPGPPLLSQSITLRSDLSRPQSCYSILLHTSGLTTRSLVPLTLPGIVVYYSTGGFTSPYSLPAKLGC